MPKNAFATGSGDHPEAHWPIPKNCTMLSAFVLNFWPIIPPLDPPVQFVECERNLDAVNSIHGNNSAFYFVKQT